MGKLFFLTHVFLTRYASFKDFEVFIWLGPITRVTVYNVTMVMLYTYPRTTSMHGLRTDFNGVQV